MTRLIGRFFGWVNRRLNIVETDPDMNAYYAWADQRLDQLAAEAREHEALKARMAARGYRLVDPPTPPPTYTAASYMKRCTDCHYGVPLHREDCQYA